MNINFEFWTLIIAFGIWASLIYLYKVIMNNVFKKTEICNGCLLIFFFIFCYVPSVWLSITTIINFKKTIDFVFIGFEAIAIAIFYIVENCWYNKKERIPNNTWVLSLNSSRLTNKNSSLLVTLFAKKSSLTISLFV